jgi:S-DNA-T family DNA segregation ATPase FtsK/SpoIIIE
MRIRLTLTTREGTQTDVEITGTVDTTLADIADSLVHAVGADHHAAITSGARPVPPTALLGSPQLRTGCILGIGPSGRRPAPGGSVLQLRVVGGPDAGGTMSLGRGRLVIGRAEDADVQIDDPDVSRAHLELNIDQQGVRVRDLDSTNGTWVSHTQTVLESRKVTFGEFLRIGNSTVSVISAGVPPAATKATADGTLLVHRPPRIREALSVEPVDFPDLPAHNPRPRAQWLAALIPTAMGIGLALAMNNLQFLAFSLLTPVTLFGTAVSERRSWTRGRRTGRVAFNDAETTAARALDRRIAIETDHRREACPDPAAAAHSILTPDCRLWERRLDDPDFLTIRLGLAELPAHIRGRRSGQPTTPSMAWAVPATVSLRDGALGLAGPEDVVRGTMRWLVGQLTALHSPRDLQIYALLSHRVDTWRWLRWLVTSAGPIRVIAVTDEQRRIVLADLVALVADRREHRQTVGPWPGPWTVVLIDRGRDLAALPGLQVLLQDGPAVGVTAVCVEDSTRLLPPSCYATARFTGETGTQLELAVPGRSTVRPIAADRVSPGWADRVARALAPLREPGSALAAGLPQEVRLADLLPLSELTSQELLAAWKAGPTASCPIGVSAAGPISMDLISDGPHALVAGSTGSGKSELLRTVVAGLASSNAPDDLAFVLIDYKGGAAFAECAGLPHTLGLVTDLDIHLTRRALMSLEAELRRREAAFAQAGVGDLRDYRSSADAKQTPLPRLVLVVDEFASLAEELPDFVSGLIGIAQRGRSLGVHLILATQRPGGVVSPEIRANMALRIALRVTDPGESADVISTHAAAKIAKSQPGRGYVRLAQGLVEFQTARIGVTSAETTDPRVVVLDEWNKPIADGPTPRTQRDELAQLRDAAIEAAQALCRPPTRQPWLAPLPGLISAWELLPSDPPQSQVAFGMVDEPARQRQTRALQDLSSGGSIAFIGAPRTGRTTALRTFIGVAAAGHGPSQLHCYVIDCASGSLKPLIDLPHCGAVVTADDPGSVARLIARMSEELNRRQRKLAELGVSNVAEANRLGSGLPWILLAVDGWEGFTATSEEFDAGRSVDALFRILRDSAAAGFTVLVSGDRAALGVRVAATLRRKFLLRLPDVTDYAMAGISPALLPTVFVPGRAHCAEDGLEVQLAVLDTDPGSRAQWTAIRRIAQSSPAAPALAGPISIRALPTTIARSDLAVEGQRLPADDRGEKVLLGVGGDDAGLVAIDLFGLDQRFLIAGPNRSGRSTALLTLAQHCGLAASQCLFIGRSTSPLASWATEIGAAHIDPLADPDDAASSRQACDFNGRLLLIDDAETLQDTMLADVVTRMLVRPGLAVAATARSEELAIAFRGISAELRRSRTGLLLQPTVVDGELLGIRLPPGRELALPGRAVLVTDEVRRSNPEGMPMQVLLPERV